MPVSEFLKNYLSQEFLVVANKIEETTNPVDKTYYFSAVYGALQRAFNIEYDSKLVLMYHICLLAHQAISGRLQALREGREESIGLSPEIFDDLSAIIRELSDRIKTAESAEDLVERISVIALRTSGNGFYLASIGRIH